MPGTPVEAAGPAGGDGPPFQASSLTSRLVQAAGTPRAVTTTRSNGTVHRRVGASGPSDLTRFVAVSHRPTDTCRSGRRPGCCGRRRAVTRRRFTASAPLHQDEDAQYGWSRFSGGQPLNRDDLDATVVPDDVSFPTSGEEDKGYDASSRFPVSDSVPNHDGRVQGVIQEMG